MTTTTIHIEVQADAEGGWSVARDRIVDGHFADLVAANDYANACAQRARRAGIAVELRIVPLDSVSNAAA